MLFKSKITTYFILQISFLIFSECVQLKPGFIATFPSSVVPGSIVKFCIAFENIDSEVSFDLYDDEPISFERLSKVVLPNEKETCFDVRINENFSENKLKRLTVNGFSESYNFSDTKSFTIKAKNSFHMIETDKPVYKPGDILRIRVLSLDYELKPLPKTFRLIYIKDSSNSRVNQWLNVSNINGLLDLEMPLSDEPNLGIWHIEIDDTKQNAKFEVKKYVLPKFQVQINSKRKVFVEEKSIEVQVCAKYSHGNNVKGKFELKSFTKKFSFSLYKEDLFEYSLKTSESSGCQVFIVNLSQLGVRKENYLNKIYLEASVTESDTEIAAKSNSEIEIVYRAYDIQLKEPTYFKPGLPIEIKLKIQSYDGAEMANELINVKIEKDQEILFEKNLLSDLNGYVRYKMELSECNLKCFKALNDQNTKSFYIKASKVSQKDSATLNSYDYNFFTGNYFTIKRWHSPKNSYIQIYKLNNTEVYNCGEMVNLKVLTTSVRNMDQKLFIQLQSRSNIISSSYYDTKLKTNKNLIGTSEINLREIEPSSASNVNSYENNIKEYELSFRVAEEMSPELRVLIFYVDNREIIPDSTKITVNKCFRNQVDLTLDKYETQVANTVNMVVTAEPDSLCAINAIDKSVTFMGARNSIETDQIFEYLNQFTSDYDSQNQYNTVVDLNCSTYQPWIIPYAKRSVYYRRPYWFHSSHYDVTKAFRESRLIYLSDYEIYKECFNYAIPRFSMKSQNQIAQASISNFPILSESPVAFESLGSFASIELTSDMPKVEIRTIRQFFPETWLWGIKTTDKKGVLNQTEKVPDTITEWIIDSYCLSKEKGLGIAPRKSLNVFQPLFVSLDLPYSVISKEVFEVKASIFNYESTCFPMRLSLKRDKRLALERSSRIFHEACICPNEKQTYKFYLRPSTFDLDSKFNVYLEASSTYSYGLCNNQTQPITKKVKFFDVEKREIIVEPEGIPKEKVENLFIVFKSNDSIQNQKLSIQIPENVVPQSSRTYLTFTGDSIGPILNNLDKLVQQPTGCGEQNMIRFAPIVSVVAYLKETDQMNPEMNELTKNYLRIGYQRQLTYRHSDGSFSAFGPQSTKENGGTWLTAFVLRCLTDAYDLDHITIDKNDLKLSLKKLLRIQAEDGSFPQVGAPLLSKSLSGGLKDQKTGLSAYVMVVILKTMKALKDNQVENQSQINKGIEYLKNSIKSVDEVDTYTLALISYAFKLANINEDDTLKIMEELDRRAIIENGFLYWTENNKKKEKEDEQVTYWYSKSSADLELTSYVLLSKMLGNVDKQIGEVVPIAKWINSQRNSLGGFHSTQDTVVALDALSKFASLFYAKDINLDISFNLNSNKSTFVIDTSNRLAVKKIRLDNLSQEPTTELSFDVKGYGTALVQLITKYSLKDSSKETTNERFEFSAFASRVDYTTGCKESELAIKTRYVGRKEKSDMAIIGIRLPTGWTPSEDSVQNLKELVDLKRYEINENKLNLYFDEIKREFIEFKIKIMRVYTIKNAKPGLISVYDYYEPIDESTTQLFEIDDQCSESDLTH